MFSLYDFLGYFFPGALFISLIYLAFLPSELLYDHILFLKCWKVFNTIDYLAVILIIASYSFGHFLSLLSTLTIEKYTTEKYGYPSKLLLSIKDDDGNCSRKKDGICTKVKNCIMYIFILPIILSDLLYGCLFKGEHKYIKSIGDPYENMIKKRLYKIFYQLKFSESGVKNGCKENIDLNFDFHKFLIYYNYEFTNKHGHKLMNYVSLYGFLRVVSLLFCFLFYVLIWRFLKDDSYSLRVWEYLIVLILISSVSYVFYLGYLKFYRRYSEENLMLTLIVNKKD